MRGKTLLTDLYQLTMNAAYFENNKDNLATFELFIRKLPKDWGYFIAAGIEDAIDYVTMIHFTDDDIENIWRLRSSQKFKDYLEPLRRFRFEGDIYAVKEGTPVTENTPILRVTAKRTQAQFLESALLNIINFQTLIASKASRIVNAAAALDAKVVDFGLRRAQGEDAALTGARACYIAGATATSNVKAGILYGIPVTGTHAHSFVMSFPSELEAFRAYVKTFPNDATLLIDTYDTLQGAKNAAIVAKELEKQGSRLGAVRLDSGDLAALSKKVRRILNRQGLNYVKILASNDLNEYKIQELKEKGAKIDGFGVGTEMITAKPVAAIPGVYKLVEDSEGPKMKLSEDKASYPGVKQVYRKKDENWRYKYDRIALASERPKGEPLLELVVKGGGRVFPRRPLEEIRVYSLSEVAKLPLECKKVQANPFPMVISQALEDLIQELTQRENAK